MNVETEALPNSELAVKFEIEPARLDRAMDAAYRRVASQVNIAGFRRGKAPRALVERVVGRETVMEDALKRLLPEVYDEVLHSTEIAALTEPEFDVESMEPLVAKATVVVPPPVRLGDYRSVHRDPPDLAVTPEEVDALIEQYRERHAEWVPSDAPATLDGLVVIDVRGTVDGETTVDQQDVTYLVDAENPSPVPGFAEQLVGLSAGDSKTFELTVPEDFKGADLAGKTTSFAVTVSDVKAKELPDLDDAFAETAGSWESLADMRAKLEVQLGERKAASARQETESAILSEAADLSTVEVPDKLIQMRATRLAQSFAQQLDSAGLPIEQYLRARQMTGEEFVAQFRDDAHRLLKNSFVLRSIAGEEGLTVSDDEVEAGVREALSSATEAEIAHALTHPEIKQRARWSLQEEKALKWLVEHATASSSQPQPASSPPQTEGEQAE